MIRSNYVCFERNWCCLLTFLFIFSVGIIVNASQKGHESNDYFLLRNDEQSISLNKYVDNKIKQVAIYNALSGTRGATDHEGTTAIVCSDTKSLRVKKLNSEHIIKESLPEDIQHKAVMVYREVIYIAGRLNYRPAVLRYNIANNSWDKLEIPSDIPFIERKGIDDLLIDGDTLLAVDNFVFPKFVIRYNLKESGEAKYSDIFQLRNNGPNEGIAFGRITKDYMGILSRAVGRGIRTNFISIYRLNPDKDTRSNFAIRCGIADFRNFLIFGDKVIISTSGEEGIISVCFSNVNIYNRIEIDLNEGERIAGLTDPGVKNDIVFIVSIKDDSGKYRHLVINKEQANITKRAGSLNRRGKPVGGGFQKPPPKPPQLRLNLKGIFTSGEGCMAVIETVDGKVYTLTNNQVVPEIRIKVVEILDDRIIVYSQIEEKRRTFILGD